MPVLQDRVQETSTTGGTGTLTLAGAVTGYRSFAQAFTIGDITYYTIDNGAGEWEIGVGTVGSGTLSRDSVLESSNANALVNFSAGTKRVFCSAPTKVLLPNQTSNSGKVLSTNGTDPSWTSTLNGITLGNITPGTGAFTTLSASSTVSGTGFSTYLASPPAIGGTTPAAGSFTTLSATGNVTLGDASTDAVIVNGYLQYGTGFTSGTALMVYPDYLSGSGQIGIGVGPTITSAATTSGNGVISSVSTAAASFTTANTYCFRAQNGTKGQGSTITTQWGLRIEDLTNGSTVYGIGSQVSSGANKWNIYASGTADNYFAGNVLVGATTPNSSTSIPKVFVSTAEDGNDISTFATPLALKTTAVTAGYGCALKLHLGYSGDADKYAALAAIAESTFANSVALAFYAGPKGATAERLRIDSAGNVGIGTNAPTYRFHLYNNAAGTFYGNIENAATTGTTTNAGISFSTHNGTSSAFQGSIFATGNTWTFGLGASSANALIATSSGSGGLYLIAESASSSIKFVTGGFALANERLRIDSVGNVGIGTSSFGTSAATVLGIKTGTAPTTGPADTVQFYSSDRSAGNTIPSFYCEGSGVVTANTTAAATHRIAIRINGTIYYFLANTAA